jgi:hypothetical protein
MTKQEFNELQVIKEQLLVMQKANKIRIYKLHNAIVDGVETFSYLEKDMDGNIVFDFQETNFQEFKTRVFLNTLMSVIEQNPKQIKLF